MLSMIFWRTVLMYCVVWVMGVRGQAPCILDDVVVQSNFNITQFLGTWYEITWISPTLEDSGNMWSNYYHVYTADQFDVVTGYYSGKDPNTGTCYSGGLVNMKTKENPAKLLQYSENKKQTSDYWILETDYSNYAIVYSCGVKATDSSNTCVTARSWLWGRSTSGLPQATKDKADTMFQNLCMNMTLLYTTSQAGAHCEPESTSGSSTLVSMENTASALLFSTLLMTFFLNTD